jgi:hypothetical protein
MRAAVIGTGFAGFGAVVGLLSRPDCLLHVFDVGLQEKLPDQPEAPVPNAKTYKGSYFTYGVNDKRWSVGLDSKRICSSHAMGGHSTVYSGAVLYPKNSDLGEWPAEARPTFADYRAILQHFDVLHGPGELDSEFPPFPEDSDLAREQSGKIQSCLGPSRVAVSKHDVRAESVRSIFTTADFFKSLAKDGRVIYTPATYVTQVRKNDRGLQLLCEKPGENAVWSGDYDAVFLGSGCINTTGIVDRSLFGDGTRTYELKNVGGLITAFVRTRFGVGPDVALRKKSNLPELFLEVRAPETSGTWSHNQITAINEQIIGAIAGKIPIIGRLLGNLLRSVLYFSLTSAHSRYSPRTVVTCSVVSEPGGRKAYSIKVDEPEGSECLEGFRVALLRAVEKNRQVLGLLPFPFGRQLADYFRGNKLGGWHFGGTLPMIQEPAMGQCNPKGEVCGLPAVYVVDSAAFPEIPGSTIALLIAAHAHRVARRWAEATETI